MGRGAVLESVRQETELLLGLFGREAQYAEHFLLELRVENTDRASADLNAVHDEIVGIGTDATRIGVHQREVLALGRRERMVHRIVTLRLVVPFEQREIDDPQRREPVVGTKSEPLAHFQPQLAQGR